MRLHSLTGIWGNLALFNNTLGLPSLFETHKVKAVISPGIIAGIGDLQMTTQIAPKNLP